MKKLMIAAAAAAMVGGAFANTCITKKDACGETEEYAGTAHKVAISLKTTVIKSKTAYNKSECSESCTFWREQKSLKINGLIWAQLDGCDGCTADFDGQNAAFWTNELALDTTFGIGVGKYGKGTDSKKIEAYGFLAGEEFGELVWAGFGSLTGKDAKEGQCGEVTDCSMWVKSISGNIAGKLVRPDFEEICGESCDEIEYAGCCEDMKLAYRAAYGTIKISYDSSTAKKVATAEDAENIASFVKLPKNVVASDIGINAVEIEE